MEWLGALVNQVEDEIYLFDLNTQFYLHANQAATKSGVADVAEFGLGDVTPELSADELAASIDLLKSGQAEIAFETHVLRNTNLVPVDAGWQRIETSGHALAMCTLRNITERKQLEKTKEAFISIVSHKLRTPLTSLYGAVKLVDDSLDLEKNTAGLMRFDIEPVDLLLLLQDVAHTHLSAALLTGVRIEVAAESPLIVMADRQRLRQVLGNLISNALKFTPAATTISLDAAALTSSRARITVTDHGPGVPVEFVSKLFERFTQAVATTQQASGGSGLGLSIVKAMTEAMGGSVACKSQPDMT